MNRCEPPHLPAGVRRALHCLSLLLLPALAPDGAHAVQRPRTASPGLPALSGVDGGGYLPALGALPLRFQEATPPPDLVTRPPAAAPPKPSLTREENVVAATNAAAAHPAVAPAPAPAPAAQAAQPATPAPTPPPAPPKEAPAPEKTPAPILPDDLHRPVRPEDFLPFFQIPGSARRPGDVNLLVPAANVAPAAPATIPPSSASYTQSPR